MLFSVITVTYNAARRLERTVASVAGQTYEGIEYVIIDGGSTDGTTDIIRRHAREVAYWESEPDEGLYDAMNKGLQKATGDYVWFMNAGDTFHSPETVGQVAALIEKEAVWPDIVYGETALTNERGEVIGRRRLQAPERLSWKSFRLGMRVCHQSFVVKRAIAPLFDLRYRYSSDVDWCIRCMKEAQRISNTHLTLSHFMEGGVSAACRTASLKERYGIMCKHYGRALTSLLHLWFAVRFGWAKWVVGKV